MDSNEQRMAAVVLKKTNWHLLSRFFLLTLLCYLDRTNLSFAALQMNQSLGFNGMYVPWCVRVGWVRGVSSPVLACTCVHGWCARVVAYTCSGIHV